MTSPRILLFGASGQLGHDLAASLGTLGELTVASRQLVDLGRVDSVEPFVRASKPDLVVNAAGYTAVDRAESDRAEAERVNALAVAAMGRAAAAIGAAVVHYSTDYVFDGTKEGPWVESDEPRPLNVYGETKLAGERALAAAGVPHVVFRTSWLYSVRRTNFARTILALARERRALSIVNDQFGAPTWTASVASATTAVLRRGIGDLRGYVGAHSGVYHLSAGGRTTWFDFAGAVLALDPRRDEQVVERVEPTTTAAYGAAARRPRNSVLSNRKLTETFGVLQTPWEEQLHRAMAGGAFR